MMNILEAVFVFVVVIPLTIKMVFDTIKDLRGE